MPTEDEIMLRVEQADKQRTVLRQAAAARVGALAAQRDDLTAQLASLDKELSTAVAEAIAVMDRADLATFTERSKTEVESWASAKPTARSKPAEKTAGHLRPKSIANGHTEPTNRPA